MAIERASDAEAAIRVVLVAIAATVWDISKDAAATWDIRDD